MKKLIFLSFFTLFGSQSIFCSSGDFVRSLGILQQRMDMAAGTAKKTHLMDLLTFIIANKPGPGSAVAQSTYYKTAAWSWEKRLFTPTKIAFAALRGSGVDLSLDSGFIDLVREVLSIFDTHEEVVAVVSGDSPDVACSSFSSLDMCESLRTGAESAYTSMGLFRATTKPCGESVVDDEVDPGLVMVELGESPRDEKPATSKFLRVARSVVRANRVIRRIQRKVTGCEAKDTEAFDQALKWAFSFNIPAATLGRPASSSVGDAGTSGTKGSASLRAIAKFEEEADPLLQAALELVDRIKALIEAEKTERDHMRALHDMEESVVPTLAAIQATLEARLQRFNLCIAAIQDEFARLQMIVGDMVRAEHDLAPLVSGTA